MEEKLPFAGDIVRTTSVRRLNKLYFAYMNLSPEVQQAYKELIPIVAVLRIYCRNQKSHSMSLCFIRTITGRLQDKIAYLLNTIFSCITSIFISSLYFGQYSGNFTRTVSSYTFVLVFPPQIGQWIQREFFRLSFTLYTSNNGIAPR